MTRHARSGNWRGRANQGAREKRSSTSRKGGGGLELEGEVRWIDREADVIHVLVEKPPAAAAELAGIVVPIGYARPRLRLRIRDRDGDGRLDGDDMALGDRIRATGLKLTRGPGGKVSSIEARRLEAA